MNLYIANRRASSCGTGEASSGHTRCNDCSLFCWVELLPTECCCQSPETKKFRLWSLSTVKMISSSFQTARKCSGCRVFTMSRSNPNPKPSTENLNQSKPCSLLRHHYRLASAGLPPHRRRYKNGTLTRVQTHANISGNQLQLVSPWLRVTVWICSILCLHELLDFLCPIFYRDSSHLPPPGTSWQPSKAIAACVWDCWDTETLIFSYLLFLTS